MRPPKRHLNDSNDPMIGRDKTRRKMLGKKRKNLRVHRRARLQQSSFSRTWIGRKQKPEKRKKKPHPASGDEKKKREREKMAAAAAAALAVEIGVARGPRWPPAMEAMGFIIIMVTRVERSLLNPSTISKGFVKGWPFIASKRIHLSHVWGWVTNRIQRDIQINFDWIFFSFEFVLNWNFFFFGLFGCLRRDWQDQAIPAGSACGWLQSFPSSPPQFRGPLHIVIESQMKSLLISFKWILKRNATGLRMSSGRSDRPEVDHIAVHFTRDWILRLEISKDKKKIKYTHVHFHLNSFSFHFFF